MIGGRAVDFELSERIDEAVEWNQFMKFNDFGWCNRDHHWIRVRRTPEVPPKAVSDKSSNG
jgi:hypothetical protein